MLRVVAMLLVLVVFGAGALHAQEADATTVLRYQWLTQGEPSGALVTRVSSDGRRQSEFEFNDRGRGPQQREEVALDEAGLIRSLRVAGRSYMGSAVDERFDTIDGKAVWTTTLDQGQQAITGPAFYVANSRTPDQTGILARALLAAEDQRLPLLPNGEARIEKLSSHAFEREGEVRNVGLYAISGIDFTPQFVWLDDELALFASIGGWMGLLPEGWQHVWGEVRGLQEQAADAYLKALAQRVTERLPERWCLRDVRVLDVDAGRLVEAQTVVVADGRIESLQRASASACEGVRTLDGGGRVLMPGLWDMHTHLSAGNGILHVAAGVTAARDLANDHEQILRLERQFGSGDLVGPRVRRSGFIDQVSPYTAPTGSPVRSLDEALEAVDWYAERGYPQIKIYSSITPEWVAPIAERVHGHGMRLSGHIPAFMTTERAVREGFDEIQHINMLFLNFLGGADVDSRGPQRFVLVGDQGGGLDLESPEVAAFIALLKERDVIVDPTVSIFDNMFRHRSGTYSPELATVVEHLPPNVRRSALAGRLAIDDANADRYAASADALLGMIRKLHEAGVRIVPGTDATAGFVLHRELELYAKAGIPNAEVLRIATSKSAAIAGHGDSLGRVAPGMLADLILVDGDPLDDISNVRRVALVFRGDRVYRTDALYREVGVRPFVVSDVQ